MDYSTFNQLCGNTLNHGDRVLMAAGDCKILYAVRRNYLNNEHGGRNPKIFMLLNLWPHGFASIYYGFDTRDGDWPVARASQVNGSCMNQLTRVVLALYHFIETGELMSYDAIMSIYPQMKWQKRDFPPLESLRCQSGPNCVTDDARPDVRGPSEPGFVARAAGMTLGSPTVRVWSDPPSLMTSLGIAQLI